MSEITTKDIVDVVEKTADVRVQNAQIKMLIEILALTTKVDTKTELNKYIKQKEKELGLCDK